MKTVLMILSISLNVSAATTYQCSGKEVTKGQAAKMLQANKTAKCVKITDITFDDEKFSIVNTKKAKK